MGQIKFSVAEEFNITIGGMICTKELNFLKKIYASFDPQVDAPSRNIVITVENINVQVDNLYKLGKDACYKKGLVTLKSGHTYKRKNNTIYISIPTKVKRGRIPFYRNVPGRHISDEILDPILQELLNEVGKTFIHASSYEKNGKVDILMAWRSTGKTEGILPNYEKLNIFSDDLTIISKDGYAFPYPRPIRIYSYNIKTLENSGAERKLITKLKLKNKITPRWRPVEYLPLKNGLKPLKIGSLNNISENDFIDIDKFAVEIINFEFSYFNSIRSILKIAGILEDKSMLKIMQSALSSHHEYKM